MAVAKVNLPADLQNFNPNISLGNVPELASAISTQTGASTQDAVTASTTQTQVGGTKIVAAWTNVSSANANDAITLPQAVPGKCLTIVNSTGQTINCFPFLGDAINAAGANNSVSIATATTSDYYCVLKGQWWGGATTNES